MQKYLYKDLYALEDIHWWHRAKRNLVSFFLDKNFPKKDGLILDVGCGTGKNLEAFSSYGQVQGIDNSPEAISFCKKRGFQAVGADIEKMPFKSGSFTAITALDVLEHVDDQTALREINRVLRKKGVVIITVPAFNWLWSKWDEVLFHKRRYTKKSLEKVLQQNGFKVEKISYYFAFLVLPTLIIRSVKRVFYSNFYPSDFKLSNPSINFLMGIITGIEKRFLINYTLPFGTSLITVARKN